MPDDPNPAWTVAEAAEFFAEGGPPISAARLRLVIRALRWKPAGHRPSGPEGGLGPATYPVRELVLLHAALAPWLILKPYELDQKN